MMSNGVTTIDLITITGPEAEFLAWGIVHGHTQLAVGDRTFLRNGKRITLLKNGDTQLHKRTADAEEK